MLNTSRFLVYGVVLGALLGLMLCCAGCSTQAARAALCVEYKQKLRPLEACVADVGCSHSADTYG